MSSSGACTLEVRGDTARACETQQRDPGSRFLAAGSRAPTAAASSPGDLSTCPVPLSMSRSGSDAVDSAVAVLAEASMTGSNFPLSGCCQGSVCSPSAAAGAQAIASGSAAEMAAMLSAHRQMATGAAESAGEIQHNLRACSGVLGSAAKSAFEASAKAGPTGGLAWQIAVLDAMPLGPTMLDYSFTARGHLPEGVQQSQLAAAFGPENEESEGEETPGKAARVQIGNALVALLESHRKHRYTVASADPEHIITKLCSLPKETDDSVEVDKKARSLTRSLTRSAASSPLVQLLATHRKRREDLTGWQDEVSCSSDDEVSQTRVPSALSGQAAQVVQAGIALSLKPLLTSAERRNSGHLPPLPLSLGRQASEPEFLPELPSGFCPPGLGSPTAPPLPPSTRSSVDGRSSMSSFRSVQAGSAFSRASSDGQDTDWATALSSITGYTALNSRSSLDGCSSRRCSTDGRPSFEGRPPLPGLLLKRADTADSSVMFTAPEPVQTGVLEGQCPGCGSLSECCCKEMELGSHPDLESIPDDLASISDFVGSALRGTSAPVTSSPKDPSSSSGESNKALRRLLLKQVPAVEEGGGAEDPGAQAQRLASRGASFSEVLESCMRSNSSSQSRRSRRPPVDAFAEPFIPMSIQSLSGSTDSNDGEDKMSSQQPLGATRAWSFDDTLQRQRHLSMRPSVLNRHSLDAGPGDKDKSDKSSYVALMAEYRNRMGMDRSSQSSSLALMAENPSASVDVSGALRQAFRNQLQSPACSQPCSPLLNGEYTALRPNPDHNTSGGTPAADPWERVVAGVKRQAQGHQQGTAQQPPQLPALENWPSDGVANAASGDASSTPAGVSKAAKDVTDAPADGTGALAPARAAMAARASLLTKPAPKEAAGPPARVQDRQGTGKPPASPRSSVDGTSMSRANSAVNSRAALSPGPLGATAAVALGIARGPGPRDEPTPFARQSCARVRASLELRRRSGDGGAPAPEPPPISSPQLPSVPVPAQLPMSFIKSPSQSQRNSIEERPSSNGKDTGSVLAAVAAQLGQSAASPRASLELAAVGRAASARRSSQLQRQLPTVDEGVATGVACNARELSLKLGVPDLRAQPSSDTSPADASHEPPDLEPAAPATSTPAAGNQAAGRLAAAHQLFFQGAQPAPKRMSTSAGMLAAENAASPLQLPGPSPRLRPLLLPPSTSASDRNALLQRVPRPSSPGTPPAVCEATPFFEQPHPERAPAPSATSFIMQGLSEGVLHAAPGRHSFGHHGLPMAHSPCASSSPTLHGYHGASSSGSPGRSTTGSHELEDTYGAYRLRSDPPGRSGSASGARYTVGSVAPSSFWLEHRAAAHHTAAGSVRGHVSMDETRLQSSTWLNTPICFPGGGSGPLEMPSEDAECLLTARRDNYVARTFSHMARARLDHAVSRSADLELLESEKWEMRFADDGPCTLSQSGASKEGAISQAKRMMSEAATAQASIFMRGEGTDQRDVDGTCCLLDALAVTKVSGKKQQDVLSTLAFLTSGSELNAGSVVASRGMATLVPLLLKRSEKTVTGAATVIANVLVNPAGQDAFAEENGLPVLSSLLSTSKAPTLLQAVLRCLAAYVQHGCITDGGAARVSGSGQPGQYGPCSRAAGNALLLERSRAVFAAVRLSSAHEDPDFTPAEAKAVSLAALDLLSKVSAVPEMKTTLRTAGLMSALAAIVTPGGADTAALLEPAIQLVAALASDLAAAVEFTAGGGILGLLAILSDSSAKGSLSMHAATVLGVLVNCRRVRGAIWAAGGGSVLLPTVATASPQALRGLLYLLSCLARFEDMRAELDGAGAVDVLLELLGSCLDTKVQAATLSLLRILTKAGKTLRAIPEHQTSDYQRPSFVPERASLGNQAADKRRSLDGPATPRTLPAAQALAASGRSQSMCLW